LTAIFSVLGTAPEPLDGDAAAPLLDGAAPLLDGADAFFPLLLQPARTIAQASTAGTAFHFAFTATPRSSDVGVRVQHDVVMRARVGDFLAQRIAT